MKKGESEGNNVSFSVNGNFSNSSTSHEPSESSFPKDRSLNLRRKAFSGRVSTPGQKSNSQQLLSERLNNRKFAPPSSGNPVASAIIPPSDLIKQTYSNVSEIFRKGMLVAGGPSSNLVKATPLIQSPSNQVVTNQNNPSSNNVVKKELEYNIDKLFRKYRASSANCTLESRLIRRLASKGEKNGLGGASRILEDQNTSTLMNHNLLDDRQYKEIHTTLKSSTSYQEYLRQRGFTAATQKQRMTQSPSGGSVNANRSNAFRSPRCSSAYPGKNSPSPKSGGFNYPDRPNSSHIMNNNEGSRPASSASFHNQSAANNNASSGSKLLPLGSGSVNTSTVITSSSSLEIQSMPSAGSIANTKCFYYQSGNTFYYQNSQVNSSLMVPNSGIFGSGNDEISAARLEDLLSNEKINLSRKRLNFIPIISPEHGQRVRYLSMQDNNIKNLDNVECFSHLTVLDISGNQIEGLKGINSLRYLKVINASSNLLLSMNYFKDMKNLEVIDLHNNKISKIEIGELPNLRLLNLESNEIIVANNFNRQLEELVDVNLKRNKIETISEIGHLTQLRRLLLSHNQIQAFSDCLEIFKLINLIEFSLEENPVTLSHANYRQYIVYGLKVLKTLDLKRISDEERRLAEREARKQIEKQKEQDRLVLQLQERNHRVTIIRQGWYRKLLNYEPPTTMGSPNKSSSEYGSNASCGDDSTNGDRMREKSLSSSGRRADQFMAELQASNEYHYEELRDSSLYLYGNVPFESLTGFPADQVTSIHFIYMEMSNVEKLCPKLKRFSKATHFEFSFNLFFQLYQIRALTPLFSTFTSFSLFNNNGRSSTPITMNSTPTGKGLSSPSSNSSPSRSISIYIHPDHNPIVKGKLFRPCFIARFGSNGCLSSLQNVKLSSDEITYAELVFRDSLKLMDEEWESNELSNANKFPNRKADAFVQAGLKEMIKESKQILRFHGAFQRAWSSTLSKGCNLYSNQQH